MSFSESLDHLIEQNRNGILSKHSSWERVELRAVATILNGFPFPSKKFSRDSGTPLLRIRDILAQTTETKYEGDFDPLYLVKSGDFLIGMDGDFNSALWNGTEALLNQRVCKLKVNESFYSKKLLSYALPGYLKAINDATSSITVKHLSSRTVEEIPLPLPPRSEQDRIVSEIEKQFTRLDDAVAAFTRVQANLKRYRASMLKAACEGRLVPTEAELARKEGRSYEPASELLKRILAERRAKWESDQLEKMIAGGKPPKNEEWKRNYEEPALPRTANLPELPGGWSWASLDQLTLDSMIGLDRGRENQYAEPVGSPYIKMNNVSVHGEVDFTNLVHVQASPDEVAKFHIQDGDLLFNTRNSIELVGKVGIVSSPPVNAVFNNNLMRIRLCSAVDPRFVCEQMTSEVFRKQMELVKRSTTNVAAVYAKDLFPLAIALPPATEQTRIAEAISKQKSVLHQLIIDCEKLDRRSAAMRQSVLKEAFLGKLVPQDPNDEPASALLERIHAERAALATNNGNQKATTKAGTVNGQRRRRIPRLAHRVSGGKGVEK